MSALHPDLLLSLLSFPIFLIFEPPEISDGIVNLPNIVSPNETRRKLPNFQP
jgi:hypothetical protein